MNKKNYSHYSDRIGQRLFIYAKNINHAQVVFIRKYKKEYPNTYVHVLKDDIRLEEEINNVRQYIENYK